MRDVFIDVYLELDAERLATEKDPARAALEIARGEADERCAREGAHRRAGDPEVVIRTGVHPLTGRDMVLVATRWPVTGPEQLPVKVG